MRKNSPYITPGKFDATLRTTDDEVDNKKILVSSFTGTPAINQYSRQIADKNGNQEEKVEDRLLRLGEFYKHKHTERLHNRLI